MFGEKDLSFGEKDLSNSSGHGVEDSKTKLVKQSDSSQNLDNSYEKIGFSDKGLEILGESEARSGGGFHSKTSKPVNSSFQELSLSYLCDDGKKGFPPEKDLSGKMPPNLKGKEVVLESSCPDETWVVRDFLQLNENKGGLSKWEMEDESGRERDSRDEKAKMGTLDLSLALPVVSLSLNASKPVQTGDLQAQVPLKPSRSLQSLAISNNVTQTTCSNDFTAHSLSYSYSHPFSHNPSCSMTRNATENYECLVGDQIWHCGEGTNGSVHSRFRPVGDGIALAGHALMNGGRSFNKESSNSFYKAASSETNLSFPSELPARPHVRTLSGESWGRSFDHFKVPDAFDERARLKFSRAAKIVLQCVSESMPVMSQIFKELPEETIELIKEYLRNLTTAPEGKDELATLQNKLERRSDLTKETLAKSHRLQLEILVSVKFGLGDFVSQKLFIPTAQLVEIFLLFRCQNINCRSLLPVDDCECKICSMKKGFCSQCMCSVCLKFDSANNTCSWVGCDMCSHSCHAACGIEKNLIRPGSSLKGPSGTSEMQFHCLGCSHASEILGFVKDVFVYCANDWGLETLIKELDCVRKIFKGSEDVKGKALYLKAQETIYRLERRVMSPSDACNLILNFFSSTGGRSSFAPTVAPKDIITGQLAPPKGTIPLASTSLLSPSATSLLRDMLPCGDTHQSSMKPSLSSNSRDFLSGKLSKNSDGLDSLEGIILIKEAEARMYQNRADEARKEAEAYCQLGRVRREKLEEEYAEKLAKLCLQETEERRRKKLEELKILESAHCDYLNMKIRMQAEIAGLLEGGSYKTAVGLVLFFSFLWL